MSCWYRLYAVLAFVCCISGILIGLFGLILIADQLVWWLSEAEWRDASMLKWVGPTDTGFKGLDLILNRVLDFLPVGVAFLSGGVILYGYGRWCADHDHWRGDTFAVMVIPPSHAVTPVLRLRTLKCTRRSRGRQPRLEVIHRAATFLYPDQRRFTVQVGERAMRTDLLLVEDNSVLAMDLQDEAAKLGIAVTVTRDPVAAVQIARDMRPAAAFVDVNLRGGYEGLDVARAICADTKVVIVTAYTRGDLGSRLDGLSDMPIYFKPLDRGDITRLLEDTLRH
jgi:CheY-like chemotaxis protein